jgi:hypothetical protein
MNHSHTGNFDIHSILDFSVFIEQGVVDVGFLHIVPEGIEFTGNGIDFWVS